MRGLAIFLLALGCARAESIATDKVADDGGTSPFVEIGPGFAQAVSPSGLVAGITGVGQGMNFIYDARRRWMDYLPGLGCDVFAINDAGDLVGVCHPRWGWQPAIRRRGLDWQSLDDLAGATLDAPVQLPAGIDAQGAVYFHTKAFTPWVYDGAGAATLPSPTNPLSVVGATKDGVAALACSTPLCSYRVTRSSAAPLPGEVSAISGDGVVAGVALDGQERVLFVGRDAFDFYRAPPGWDIGRVRGVNSRGDVVLTMEDLHTERVYGLAGGVLREWETPICRLPQPAGIDDDGDIAFWVSCDTGYKAILYRSR